MSYGMEICSSDRTFNFTIGDDIWVVPLIRLKRGTHTDFIDAVNAVSNIAITATLNARECLKPLGFEHCRCSKNDMCIVAEVLMS